MPDDEILLETRRFRVVRQSYRLPDGCLHTRETIQHPGAVVILPLLSDERLVLIRNFRIAVGKTLLELPAGTREPNEDPLVTARRELEEETGLVAGRWEHLIDFYMSPGILRERMHFFVATELREGTAKLDAGEQIETLPIAWNDAIQMCARGEICDAKTLAALLWYDRFRKKDRG